MKTRFGRNAKVFAIAILALVTSLILFDSCNQEEFINPKMKIKIFTSSSLSDGLKSASLAEAKTEVTTGDTIVQPRGHILMWATTENGLPIKGYWGIELIKTDYSDIPGIRTLVPYVGFSGDQIAYDFPEIGIYRVTFGKLPDGAQIEEQISFFVRIWDYPGKVGDTADNNYIFRLENKAVYDLETQKPKNLVFAYFKFESAQNMKPEQAYVLCADFQRDGSQIRKMIHLTKWPFSRDYYYLTIEKTKNSLNRYLLLYLISENQGFMGVVDQNNFCSSWSNGTSGIEFAVQ